MEANLAQLWKSKASEDRSERRDQTAALLLLVVAVIAGLMIAVLLGDSIAFPLG